MKYNILILSLSFLILFSSFANQLYSQSLPVEKCWEGYLKVAQNDSLKLGLALTFQNDSLIGAEFDSPDQYVYGIKTSSYKIVNDTLKVISKQIGAHFMGVLNENGDYVGIFTQRNSKFNLSLLSIPERSILNRPQEPKSPYLYSENQLVIKDDLGFPLIKGTLTYPSKPLKATLILISGSGWQDRDETILGHKPFKVIADYLSNNGYAVFRYDDRLQSLFATSTTFDFVSDVQLIVNYFKTEPQHQDHKIGLLGHSEGGLVAFMAAAENPDIDFVISMAGCGEHFSKIILYQAEIHAKNEGLTDQEVEETLKISNKIYQMLAKEDSPKLAIEKFHKIVSDYTQKMSLDQKKRLGLTDSDILIKRSTISSPWFMTLFKIYPEKYLKKIDVPVYALNGEKDLQVNYATNLPIIQKRLSKKSPLNKIESIPNLNHLFQECETGLLDEYGKIEQTIDPKVLDRILLWLDLVNKP